MNDNQQNYQQVKEKLATTKSIFIFISQNANLDATAAALALYLSLIESGKSVMIGSSGEVRVEHSRLVGVDKITDKIGNRNLVITFDYQEDSIDKVSYNVEGKKFNLVIEPRQNQSPLDKNSVEFSYEGLDADLIFVIGAQKLEALGALYEKERQAFSKATIVNIDKITTNTKFGQINIIDPKSPSISELVFQTIKNLALPITIDIAGNVLKGVEAQTQNLQAPFVGAKTFETVAELMRTGAKRSTSAPQPMRRWSPGQTAAPGGRFPASLRTPPSPFPSPAQRPQMGAISPNNSGQQFPSFPLQNTGLPLQTNFSQPQISKPSGPVNQISADNQIQQNQASNIQNLQTPSQGNKRPRDQKKFNKPNQNQQQPKKNWSGPKIYSGKTRVK